MLMVRRASVRPIRALKRSSHQFLFFRAQRSIGLALSVIVFIGYYLFLVLGQTLAEKGVVSPAPALWMGNGVFLAAGCFLLWRTARQ